MKVYRKDQGKITIIFSPDFLSTSSWAVSSSCTVSIITFQNRYQKPTFDVEAWSGFKRGFVSLQELNRLRKAALAFGFLELLKGVADMLERECTLLPDTAHPDAAFQLTHAAQQLKVASTGTSEYAAYEHNIAPLQTDFSSSSTERMWSLRFGSFSRLRLEWFKIYCLLFRACSIAVWRTSFPNGEVLHQCSLNKHRSFVVAFSQTWKLWKVSQTQWWCVGWWVGVIWYMWGEKKKMPLEAPLGFWPPQNAVTT